ncbi:MAG: hypothetical protein ACKV22_08395 [Bryobacteraceae bacterium]
MLPVEGGALRKLQDNAGFAVLSADGSRIAFHRSAEIWVMNAEGGEPRRLLDAPPGYSFSEALAWSPDGSSIAYGKRSQAGDEFAIESYDLNTGRTRVILSDAKIGGFCWVRDGRIIYARLEARPNETSANLWEVRVGPGKARVGAKPRRLSNWGGFLIGSLHISADGRRLSFVRQRFRHEIYVGQLEGNGDRLAALRRLTFDEWINWPTGWTPDSQAVLFYSDRNGDVDIFKQSVAARQALPIVTGQEEKRDARMSPNGRWILYLAWPKEGERIRAGEGRLMRVAAGAGAPETVLRVSGYPGPVRALPDGTSPATSATGHPRFRCPSFPQSPCVLSEQTQNRVVFTAFDPVKGRQGEVATINIEPRIPTFWDLSPDGGWIAFGSREEHSGQIRLVPLAGQKPHTLSVRGWSRLESAAWAADGQALFLTSYSSNGFPLLRVSLNGEVRPLHTGRYYTENPVPSPDGRYLAFGEITPEGNVWLIEDLR